MFSSCIGRSGVLGDVGERISNLLIPARRRVRRRRKTNTSARKRINPTRPPTTLPIIGASDPDLDACEVDPGGRDEPAAELPGVEPEIEGLGLEDAGLDGLLLLNGVSAEKTVIASMSMKGPVPS